MESSQPITLQQKPKVFGAPPPQPAKQNKKPVSKKSSIPKKKSTKPSNTPTLVVCSTGDDPTPYERKPINLGSQRKGGSPASKADVVIDNNEEDENIVVLNSGNNSRQSSPNKSPKTSGSKIPSVSKRNTSPQQSSSNSPSKSKQNANNDYVLEENDEQDEKSHIPQRRHRKHKKSVNSNSNPQEEEIESNQINEGSTENSPGVIRADSILDNDEDEAQNNGEKRRRRKRHHHRHTGDEEANQDDQNDDEFNERESTQENSTNEGTKSPTKTQNKSAENAQLDDADKDAPYLFENFVDDLMSSTDSAMSKLAQWQKSLLNNLLPLEYQQLQRWYIHTMAYLEAQNIVCDSQDIKFRKNLEELVSILMEKHRFATTTGAFHRMRIMISGPRRSGKSTLLGLAAERAIIELAASGEWKRTLLFAYDFAANAHAIQATDALYQTIVRATFAALSAQRPLLAEHCGGLSRCFCDIIDGNPLIPKAFQISNDYRTLVPQLQQIIQLISECWAEEDKSPFITNALSFPLQIAKVFGFDRVLVIADHFDAFSVGDALEDIFLMENVKNLLDLSSFIAAVQDQDKAAECVKPGPRDGVDLTQSIFKISTLDIVEDDEYAEREFSFQVEGEGKRININAGFFGGCPAFLKLWDELNEVADQVEKDQIEEEEDDDEQKIEKREERRILLTNKATQILNALTEGQTEFVVTSVNKVSKKSTQKQDQ